MLERLAVAALFASIIGGYAWVSAEPGNVRDVHASRPSAPSLAVVASNEPFRVAASLRGQRRVYLGVFIEKRPETHRNPLAHAPGIYTDDMLCLAELIYWEARGEPIEGQRAVADVVMARLDRRWRGASTVCEIARDPAQFEGMEREGEPKAEREAWRLALRIAKRRILGPWETEIAADHFWAGCHRTPPWVDTAVMEPVECIGGHWFWLHG